MLPPESRSTDRTTVHYTMKTSIPPSSPSHMGNNPHQLHSHPNSQPFRATKSSTPLASPHFAHSVGQPYPPKLSPSVITAAATSTASRLTTTTHTQVVASDARTPSPSYFGLVVEPAADPRDSAMVPRENWSPPTSSVRSFAAAISKQPLPLDANPEFEAFRRQADANRGRSGFALATSHCGLNLPSSLHSQQHRQAPAQAAASQDATRSSSGVTQPRPRVSRWHTYGSDTSTDSAAAPRSSGPVPPPFNLHLGKGLQAILSGGHLEGRDVPLAIQMDIDSTTAADTVAPDNSSVHDSAYVSADSKRNSEASLNAPSFFNMPRHESPAQFESPFDRRTTLSTVEDRHPRLSVVQGKLDPPTPNVKQTRRADTLPSKTDASGPTMVTATELKEILDNASSDHQVLLLDLRVSTLYSASRIQGALNLCIPTTLLKRPTFNLEKLQQTFQSGTDREKFAAWRATTHLVVYDAFSADRRDAVPCVNMLKKFTSEGYTGKACILRGGFKGFSEAYPQFIDRRPSSEMEAASDGNLKLSSGDGDTCATRRPSVAPVIGGVMLPTASDNPNPFFSNIRQNMDLADGVGQMDVAVPIGLDQSILPAWLRKVADSSDHGKEASEKFLGIEKKEQARMKTAYNAYRFNASTQPGRAVQISGIEMGAKNRYNNILPFEHARVRLEGKRDGDCDYINASHITSTRSHKRYIASQGPLPETFEDFWSMIWDQDVRVIVMLTAEREGGHWKCHPYWRGKEFGPIRLRSLSERKVSLDIDRHRSNSAVSNLSSLSTGIQHPPNTSTVVTPGPQSVATSQTASEGRRRANTTTTLEGPTSAAMSQPDVRNPAGAGTGNGNITASSNSDSGGVASPTFATGTSQGGETPFVIIRKFALSHAAHPFAPIREITQLHYPSWPDFGAPAQPSHLLGLVELANVMQHAALPLDVPSAISSASASAASEGLLSSPLKKSPMTARRTTGGAPGSNANNGKFIPTNWHDEPESKARVRPMLVHCSAGCGRTGTFCTVDSVIDMLKRQRLRAVRRANAAVAARERKVREGTKRKLAQRDSEGDIPMLMDMELSYSSSSVREASRYQHQHHHRDDGSVSPKSTVFSSPPRHYEVSSSPGKLPKFVSSQTPTTTAHNSSNDDGYDTPARTSSPASSSSSEDSGNAAADDADLDLSWMDDDTVDLVAGTVEDFRSQRLSMVQTIRQYVLCCETVLEWIWRLQEKGVDGFGYVSSQFPSDKQKAATATAVSGATGAPRPGRSGSGLSRARAKTGSFRASGSTTSR